MKFRRHISGSTSIFRGIESYPTNRELHPQRPRQSRGGLVEEVVQVAAADVLHHQTEWLKAEACEKRVRKKVFRQRRSVRQ